LRDGARAAGHFRRVLRHDNVDLDLAQWNGVTQRNKMRRLLGCLNSSDARGRDDIALGDFISTDKIDGFFAQSNFSRRHRGARAERFLGNIDHPGATIRADVTEAAHKSAADCDHLPTGLIIFAEVVLQRFSIDDVDKELPQLVIACARAQWFHDVELERASQTRTQFAVASEAQLVAALAEVQIGHRADKSNALGAPGNLVIGRGTVCAKAGFRNQIAVMRFDRTFGMQDRHEVFFAQNFARAHRHQLDETQDKIARRGEFNERQQLIVIAATHQNAIELDLFETGGAGRVNSFEHGVVQIAAGDLRIKMSIQGIERDVDRVNAGRVQGRGHGDRGIRLAGEQRSIRGKSDVVNAGDFWKLANEFEHAAPRQWFPARDSYFGNAEIGRDPNETQRFLEGQDSFARQPLVQLTRHAIAAALIAAVGNRHPQIGDAMTMSILHLVHNVTDKTGLNQESATID